MCRSSKRARRQSGSGWSGKLRRSEERWEGGWVSWGGEAGFVLWVESEDGPIVTGGLLEPGRAPEPECVRLLLQALRAPDAGPPRLPAEVAVREDALAAALRAALGELPVEVVVLEALPSFEQAARELKRHLETEAAPGYVSRGVPAPLAAAFFQAAADFYRAEPWREASDDVALALRRLDQDEPVFALVLGAEGLTHGLALYRSLSELQKTWSATSFPPPPVNALAVTYANESDAPAAPATERRSQRWPLAGPSAFPIPFRTTVENEGAIPDAEELAEATLYLGVVKEFVERERRTVRSGRAARGLVTLTSPDARGRPREVTVDVAYPVRPEEDAGFEGLDEGTPAVQQAFSPLEELHERIMADSAVRPLLRRLTWVFHGAPSPDTYLEGADAIAAARLSAGLWAMYLAKVPPDGRTVAERVLGEAPDLDEASRAQALRQVKARFIVGVIEESEGEEIILVRQERTRELLRLRGGNANRALRGDLLVGVSFPGEAEEEELLAQGTRIGYEDELARTLAREAPEDAAVLAQRILMGAGPGWIEDLAPREARLTYQDFLEDCGLALPDVAELEAAIVNADSPAGVAQESAGGLPWLHPAELEIYLALLMRIWNTTPRAELDGHSPDEAAQAAARRPKRPGGRRRKK